MFNAHVIVDTDGKLATGSAVTVDIPFGTVTASVPPLAVAGGVMFWPRVREALKSVGWTLDGVGPDRGWRRDGDTVRFNAKKI